MLGVGAPGSQGTSTSQNLFVGNGSSAGQGGTAVGYNSYAGVDSAAFGTNAYAAGPNDTAIGYGSKVGADHGTAVGSNTSINSSATYATAVGYGASVGQNGYNSVALGANSVANQPNTVSVGAPGNERRITNVEAGFMNTDAANFGQVRKAYSGVAMGMAMQAAPLNLNPGEKGISGGYGYFNGESAVAFKFQGQLNTHWSFGAGVGVGVTDGGGNDVGASAGLGYKW